MRSESVWNGAVTLIFTAVLAVLCLLFTILFAAPGEAEETGGQPRVETIAYTTHVEMT